MAEGRPWIKFSTRAINQPKPCFVSGILCHQNISPDKIVVEKIGGVQAARDFREPPDQLRPDRAYFRFCPVPAFALKKFHQGFRARNFARDDERAAQPANRIALLAAGNSFGGQDSEALKHSIIFKLAARF